MSRHPGGVIAEVWPGSIADDLGLVPGDRIWAIDGHPLADLVDYKARMAGDAPVVHITRVDGEEWEIEVEKDPDEDLGVTFESVAFDSLRKCQNRCVFCFVDQMPVGLRPTLYVKDDDYRLSFCQGSYISLTNLTQEDIQRIIGLRLGPLYISVHATDPEVRRRLLRNPHAGDLLPILRRLAEARIEMHAQVVLCPGINDGEVLAGTLDDLAALHPALSSVAVVPVGLSRHREGLAPLSSVSRDAAKAVVKLVTARQALFYQRFGTRLAFLADEFYWLAEAEIPEASTYEQFSQLEDGVGLSRSFWDDAMEAMPSLLGPGVPRRDERFVLVTGVSGARVLQPLSLRLSSFGVQAVVLPVANRLLGEAITVSGLLSGADIADSLHSFFKSSAGSAEGEWTVLLPDVMFRTGNGKTLDDLTPADIAQRAATPHLEVIPTTGNALIARLSAIPPARSEIR